jgi:ADP-heptose:LPS heptosyltransferase
MINYYLKQRVKNITSNPPHQSDIKKSKKILFSIFTRYGDTIINLMVIKEFIESYPKKDYLILCPRQMKPYVNEFLPEIECKAFNKRNLFQLIKVVKILKKRKFDIGFNPWSSGLDSSFFISFCEKFLFYKDFAKPKVINHYEVVRNYLKLFEKKWEIKKLKLKDDYQKILICPQSTDSKRNLPIKQLDRLITDFQRMYSQPKISIASSNKSDFRDGCNSFKFKKSPKSSIEFIELVKTNTLIVCVDSGPLHIALALQKNLIALMSVTTPETVINTGSCLRIDKFEL